MMKKGEKAVTLAGNRTQLSVVNLVDWSLRFLTPSIPS
jgi:hypothetical protein